MAEFPPHPPFRHALAPNREFFGGGIEKRSEIFGWKLTKMGQEYGGYVMVQTGPADEKGMPQRPEFINGGMMQNDAIKSPTVVVAVDDCDATVKKMEDKGGKLVGEIVDIPNVGRYAYVQDSEGNVIGVMKPLMPGPQM